MNLDKVKAADIDVANYIEEERLNGKYKTTLYNAPSQGLYLVEVSYD